MKVYKVYENILRKSPRLPGGCAHQTPCNGEVSERRRRSEGERVERVRETERMEGRAEKAKGKADKDRSKEGGSEGRRGHRERGVKGRGKRGKTT